MNVAVDQIEKNMIYAVNYMPDDALRAEEQALKAIVDPEVLGDFSEEREGVLIRLFGEVPNYADERMEQLWEEVLDHDPEYIYEYCFLRGVDLFMSDGKPVPPWRDIAVMLMAIEKGYMDLA